MIRAPAMLRPRLPVVVAAMAAAVVAGCAGNAVYSLGPQEIRQEAARELAGPPADGPAASGAVAPGRRDYPNINVPPAQPEGQRLSAEEQAAEMEMLRRQTADGAGAADERRLTAAERELLRRQREVQARHEADRALLCAPREGEPLPAACR